MSVAVAIADKLDTLAGFFAIGEMPTGSKDPFALRRAALGVIRLIMNWRLKRGWVIGRLHLSLASALTSALAGYGNLVPEEPGPEATRDALLAFFADRVKVHLREQGVRHDHIDAVLNVDGVNNLVLLEYRVDALKYFLDSDDGANLLTAYRRAANILRIEEKKDDTRYEGKVDPDLFNEGETEERALYNSIADARKEADFKLGEEDFLGAMAAMAALRTPCGRLLRPCHGQLRGRCAAPQPAADALPDPQHAGSRRRLLEDRGLSRGRLGLSLRRGCGGR